MLPQRAKLSNFLIITKFFQNKFYKIFSFFVKNAYRFYSALEF